MDKWKVYNHTKEFYSVKKEKKYKKKEMTYKYMLLMDKPWIQYAQWKNQLQKSTYFYSIYMRCSG